MAVSYEPLQWMDEDGNIFNWPGTEWPDSQYEDKSPEVGEVWDQKILITDDDDPEYQKVIWVHADPPFEDWESWDIYIGDYLASNYELELA